MSILEALKENKGTVSTALSKELADKVLAGDGAILEEAVDLTTYMLTNKKEKNVRCGAAKTVELVAFEKPELVAPYLEKLLPALDAHEPQTRWMAIRIMGLCAASNESVAEKALGHAKEYIRKKKAGQLCLVSSADHYLGDYGAISRKNTEQVYGLLWESVDNLILNEHDWLMEAFIKISPNLDGTEKEKVRAFALEFKDHPRKATLKRIEQIEKICNLA